jgi:hypothetical protein
MCVVSLSASGISRECVRRQSAGMAHHRREIKVEASINKHRNRGFPVRTVRPRDRPSRALLELGCGSKFAKCMLAGAKGLRAYIHTSAQLPSLKHHDMAALIHHVSYPAPHAPCCRLKLWWPHVQTTPTVRPRSRLTFGSGRHFTQVTKDDATPLTRHRYCTPPQHPRVITIPINEMRL